MDYSPSLEIFVIFLATYLIWMEFALALVIFLRSKKSQQFLIRKNFVWIFVLSVALAFLSSLIYSNPRPFIEGGFEPLASNSMDNGFPSDHMLFASIMAFSFSKTHKIVFYVFLLFAILIGVGRVLAGVHHIVDIIGSLIIVTATSLLYSKIKSLRS